MTSIRVQSSIHSWLLLQSVDRLRELGPPTVCFEAPQTICTQSLTSSENNSVLFKILSRPRLPEKRNHVADLHAVARRYYYRCFGAGQLRVRNQRDATSKCGIQQGLRPDTQKYIHQNFMGMILHCTPAAKMHKAVR